MRFFCCSVYIRFLTHFILMDYPVHIDTTSMALSILYFKGLLIKISIEYCISVPEDRFLS